MKKEYRTFQKFFSKLPERCYLTTVFLFFFFLANSVIHSQHLYSMHVILTAENLRYSSCAPHLFVYVLSSQKQLPAAQDRKPHLQQQQLGFYGDANLCCNCRVWQLSMKSPKVKKPDPMLGLTIFITLKALLDSLSNFKYKWKFSVRVREPL